MTRSELSLPARHLSYVQRTLHIEEMSLSEVAREVGTPTFVYSGRTLDATRALIDKSLHFVRHSIAYAAKANSNLAILKRFCDAGCGVDVVSYGELTRAMRAGFSPDRIVFSGVGKRDDEIIAALDLNIRAIHVESAPEVFVVEHIAAQKNKKARIALRINPDVDPATHPYIATGLRESKFGLDVDEARRILPDIARSKHLALECIAAHIGSQIGNPNALREAVAIVANFAKECIAMGISISSIDAGGGWPVPYGNEKEPFAPAEEFGKAIRSGLEDAGARQLNLEIIVEPGRSMVAEAGVLLTQVLYVKEQNAKRFVIVDASMTELIRPALYDAYHAIVPVREPNPEAALNAADVVGPVCETGDFLALDRSLPPIQRGDWLAVCTAGAYGSVMASNYNSRLRPAEVMVEGSSMRIIREREPIESLWAQERP